MTKTRREMLELMGAAGAIVAAAKFGLVSPALAQGAGDVPVAQLMDRLEGRAGDDHRIRLDDLPALRPFRQ
jgi:hypothetical protein